MNENILQVSAANGTSSINYFPVGIQLIFAAIFVFAVLAIASVLGPRRKTEEKLRNFESGIESVGNARQPMSVKYFLVAILFVLFDVEVIFFYPYAVNFKAFAASGHGWETFSAVLLFIAFFLAGFVYIIKKGALQWED
ncbi:MAG TPA: NADH-quinone oxidoreductase subunit A [Puia sp.]|nr:NADH-quinone oxidoreductase subunit A [Puia sp.]